MYPILKSILFKLDAEKAHYRTLQLFRLANKTPIIGQRLRRLYEFDSTQLHCEKMGLKFQNPVGLAAGFDKDAAYIDLMAQLGFGFY